MSLNIELRRNLGRLHYLEFEGKSKKNEFKNTSYTDSDSIRCGHR